MMRFYCFYREGYMECEECKGNRVKIKEECVCEGNYIEVWEEECEE